MYSGGLAAGLLADLGADVIVVEHPSGGSPMRTMLPQKDGESLWWKVVGRGKRGVTIDLSTMTGQALVRRLGERVDVVVENFRPGTLERWQLGPDDFAATCGRLVMLRISGYGQTGPMRDHPGYGTIAEAMSGFAHLNGTADQPPVFPSVALADGVAATFGALGIVAALLHQLRTASEGVQVVDMALFEGLFRLIPVQLPAYDQLGVAMKRPGNFLGSHGVLRNLYLTSDDVPFCVSAVGREPIRRILSAAGLRDLATRVDTAIETGGDYFERFLEVADRAVNAWAAEHDWLTVEGRLAGTGAVFQRVYDARDIDMDLHYRARDDVILVQDQVLGQIAMAGVIPKFPGLEHRVRRAGPALGEDTDQVFRQLLGLSSAEVDALRHDGVV